MYDILDVLDEQGYPTIEFLENIKNSEEEMQEICNELEDWSE